MLPRQGSCGSTRCSLARRRSVSATLRATSARSTYGAVAKKLRRSSQIGERTSGARCARIAPIWLDLRSFFATAPYVERALVARSVAETERRLARLHRVEPQLPWRGSIARNADRRLAAQRALVLAADAVLPASEVEAYLYGERLRAPRVPFVVAPLGVDDDAFAFERPHERAGVLCVGRVEPKKNQAALLYALREVDVDVTIVGNAYDARYLALCRRWAGPRTRFVDHLAHDQVVQMMARAAASSEERPG